MTVRTLTSYTVGQGYFLVLGAFV